MRRSAFSMMVNDSIADAVMNLHCLKEKPVVVRNFPPKWIIDENEIEKRRNAFLSENCLPNNAKIVLYQGALSKRRGIENAIKAISYLGEDYYLVILGNGLSAYVESLQKIVGDLRLSSRVFFIPAVSYTELWKYTGIADVGLCILENVCTNHFFALPNKFSEYIQSLVPVVSSNFPELVRIIDRYNVGIYCNADDPKELSNAISKVLSSKEVVLCYKENLKLAKEVLNWERESKVLTKAYGELISNIKVSK